MLPSDLTLSALRFILSAKPGQSCKQDCETVDFCNSLKWCIFSTFVPLRQEAPKIQPYVLQDTTIKRFTPSSDALAHSLSQGATHKAEPIHGAYSHDALRLTRETLTTGREACTAERLSDTR